MIVRNLIHNAGTAQDVIKTVVARLPVERTCECASALASAVITRPEAVSAEMKATLAPILGKYLN